VIGRLDAVEVELADLLDVVEDLRELGRHPLDLSVIEAKAGETGDMEDLVAIDHDAEDRMPPGMSVEKAERFVRLNLLLMAGGFAITGFFFIAWPDGTLARLTELGGHLGFDTPAPPTDERLWLSLGFAYMVVITFLALIAGRAPNS